jgi:hypothetical protein
MSYDKGRLAMTFFTEEFVRTLIPCMSAALFGCLIFAAQPTFQAVEDGNCTSFTGTSVGNDTTQQVKMTVCRDHDRVQAVKYSTGHGGTSIHTLAGQIVDNDRLQLLITETNLDAPSPGWRTCQDDIFSLRYDPKHNALIGVYHSAECKDLAHLYLEQTQGEQNCGLTEFIYP